ncbi:hypothetical protein E8E13_010837 [Curvularia kusanoi]|uniref:Uncharacterized protein n=1 Tax=Curvularia kusanoi TaxID=90978 RepID=A0A9P4TQ74_CURKU|nr:hypothetical protein E8E13_010837 [Curvularia kusanoi]
MGQQTVPSEAAPAYDHIFEHPTNTNAASGSARAYAAVPQSEPDIELAQGPIDPSAPHQHCETCDALTTAREVRANERFNCVWVSIVVMTLCVAALLLVVAEMSFKYRHEKAD